jgi:hypothetical protein
MRKQRNLNKKIKIEEKIIKKKSPNGWSYLDSEYLFSIVLTVEKNSMILWSLRKSSLGLHRKTYSMPSSPITVIFLGLYRNRDTELSRR